MSNPREEWFCFDVACMGSGIITVGLMSNEPENVLAAKFAELNLQYVCVDHAGLAKLKDLYKLGQKILIKTVICLDPPGAKDVRKLESFGVKLVNFSELLSFPLNVLMRNIDPNETCMIAYTGGTVAAPKAVQLSHKAFMSAISAILYEDFEINHKDTYILYTNLALFGEKLITYSMAAFGSSIGIANDFKEDIKLIRPTLLLAVPRVLDFLHSQIRSEISKKGGLSELFFNKFYKLSLKNYEKRKNSAKSFWNKLIFKRIRESLGNRLRYVLTGSSAPNPSTVAFMEICLGCEVISAYGLVETGYSNLAGTAELLTPLSGTQAKLCYHPDMRVSGLDPRDYGELVIKRDFFTNLRAEKQSAEPSDWFRTGDLFQVDTDRRGFRFLERIEYAICGRSGWSVFPQKLEAIYRQSQFVVQMAVFGDSRIDGVVGVVVVNEAYVASLISNAARVNELKENPVIIKEIIRSFDEIAEQNKLEPFERVLEVTIETELWTSSELVTCALKFKRKALISRYSETIENMIKKHSIS
jgi:long-chain acyl-CoA synthetase